MASRHEIVTIDFRANAAKANPAMKSLQQAAHDLREEIDKTRAAASEAAKNGAAEAELQKFEDEITSQMKTLKQYNAAIDTLSKGVGTLARAIDAFNSGTLDKMNAAFQKQSFNAAENAKKLLVPGSDGYEKNMAELDALQQKNLENLAKYKLRTEQLLQSVGEGGKISATDLKTEADGLEELMKLLPHLGSEWQEYYQILLRVRDAIKQQVDEEKRLKGAIADANDARARSAQLTRQGADDARRQHEEAKKVADGEAAVIGKLKEEREEKRKNMAGSAAVLQQKEKEIESQRKTVASYEAAIRNEKKDIKAREDRIATLKQENETLQTTAEANRRAVEQMKGDMKGLEDQLKDVNGELEKMGASRDEKPAAAAAPGAAPKQAAAGKDEERQAVEEKAEADKKEEQAVKNKTRAKKEETQAVKENTEAKKEEAKAGEKVAEAEKKEDLTKEQILKRQDELKAQLQDLYREKKEYARQQEQNTAAAKKEAEAVKEEANAYKDLTKEQAEALLQQKRATITKGEDGKFSFTNGEEAQHFIMESIRQMGGKNGNEYSLSDKGKVEQLLGQFKERYGLQSDDDTVGAIRGLFASGGLVESGVMNPFLPRMNVKASESAAAYAKDMKDLTAVINGNTEAVKENIKATEESNKVKRTEADIDADIEARERESHRLTMQLRRMNGELDTTEQLIKKKGSLAETSRKSAEAFKEELAVLRSLNKEQAALMLKGMTDPSTVKFKGGTPFASDIEEVQSWLIKNIKGMVGNGHAFDEGGTLRLDEKGIASMVERFKERYKFDGSKKDLNDLFKSVVQSKGGLFESGFVSDFGKGGKLSINYDALAFEQRIKVMDTLTEVSGGAAKATDKVTKSTKDNTAAAKENTDAISEQERKVADLKQKWDDAKEEYQKYNDEYKRQMREVKRLEKGSIDEQLLAREKESAAETYKETYVDKAATRRDQYKQLYTSSSNKLNRMRKAEGQEIQEATAAENRNTEATERNTQAKGRKAKAAKAAADAQKEQNKADGESIAQGQQLSAEEQKKQDLLRKREALQGQLNEKQEKANQLEEQAAGADTKRENNLKTITNLQNENVNAHIKNEQAYGREKEKLEKLESQQDKNIHKYNEDKEAVEGLTRKIDEHATKRAEASKRAAQTERLTIDAMNDAVKALEAENRAIDPQSAKWHENTKVIQQYKAEIDRLKNQPVLQMMTDRMGNIRNLSADALAETRKFWEQMAAGAEHGSHKLAVYEGNLKVIAEEERQRQQQVQAPMRERLSNLGRLSTADLTETKRYWQAMRDGADQTSAAYKKAELAVKALTNEEQRRKDHAQAQYISDQMKELNNLSVSGLAEVKRYWQAMADGAKRGSDEAKDAANALARINEVELRNTKQQVRPLFGDLSKKGTEEIRAAIEAGRRLIDTYDSGSPAAQRLAQAIVDAEEHLKKYGVEAERAARREAAAMEEAAQRRREQDSLMRQQLDQGTALSESALNAQRQYWQRLIDDPKTAKESLAGYRYELERTIELQEQQAGTTRDERAARLDGMGNYSEGEIREAIEAGKQLIQTYGVGSREAEELAKKIVAAEERIKQYGLEAQRAAAREAKALQEAAQKQKDSDTLMSMQLRRGLSLSETALKAQVSYWQRLIDDPKTAASSISLYEKNLRQAKGLLEGIAAIDIDEKGKDALSFFRAGNSNASASLLQERAKELKAYRDSLPQKTNAKLIEEIDAYLRRAADSAKRAAGEVMNLKQALRIGLDAKGGGFRGTVEQLTQAKKTLEQLQQTAVKGGLAWRRMQDGIDSINLELKRTSYLSKEVQDILDKPKGRSLNALKQAVEQGRAALQNMDRTTEDGQKSFDELAKKIKATELELKQMAGEAKATTSAFDKAWSRLKTYVGLYVGASVAMNKLMGTIGDIHELSDRMGEVAKTTDLSADAVGRLTTNLKKIDTRTGIVQLLELSAAAGQLGLKSEEDIQGFTEAANKLMVALPEMGKEAATEMMRVAIATGEVNKIQKEMQEGTIEGSSATAVAMEKIASTIDRLRASSASAAPEITDFVKRVGAVGAQSGITIDQVAALGSTVSSLGMRIEMSATALSRMIPAIKGNAFELSKAIGVTPETIRNLFDTGRGMEVILMILQRIKDSGMDADSIENMLGMAGMKDIMKDLNQQGARAGIVFSGLSQNVDELRRQLGVAKEAYEENIAIQKEYDRMNETTAAKWERLKNQVEEMFVGDASQRMLGGLIDGLKWLLSLVTDNSRAFMYAAIAIGTFKAGLGSMVADGITKLKGLKFSIDSVKKSLLTWPNLWNAIGTVAVFAIMKIVEAATSLGEVSKSMGEVEKQLRKEMATADKLFRSLAKVREEERHAAEAAKEQAAAEEKKNKTTENSTEKAKQLSKETEKLAKSEKDAAEQAGKVEDGMKRVNAEGNQSAAIIREINSKYGTYLGYMLSETSSARQLADARELINKKLRETITLKQREAAMSDIEQNYGSKVRKGASSTDDLIAQYFSGNDEAYARVSVAVNEAAQKYAKDSKKFNEEVRKIVTANRKYISQGAKKDFRDAYAQSGRGATDDEIVSSIASNIGVRAEDYRKSVEEYQKQTETAERVFEARTNVLRKESREATVKTLNSVMADWREALDKYKKAEGEEKEKLAVEVYKQQRAYNNLFANNSDYFTNDSRKGTIERSIENMKTYEKGLREVADESIRAVDAAERAETKITNTDFTNGGNGANNPWGTPLGGESTDWKNMTAEQLVNRRKQMKDFVNAIQTDTDVQSVLKEDAALKAAIEKGMSSDMRTVIEWYNTERLKIQDELHARHLTNTGDWMDPKQEKARQQRIRSEWKAYLDELDAYYTERKAKIQEAYNDEGISEEEAKNRTLANEKEWRQRRMELLKMYAEKSGEVTQDEQDAIWNIISDRTGDDVKFVKATYQQTLDFMKAVGAKAPLVLRKAYGQIGLEIEKDGLRLQSAVAKHVKAIADIINKERPFSGIADNMRKNLVTMDILTADMNKKRDEMMKRGEDMTKFNLEQGAEELKRTTFLLGEAENAYTMTVERLLDDMRKKGFREWADAVSSDTNMQQGLLAMLRQTFDAVQDAIKKESSIIKKQVDIMFEDVAEQVQQDDTQLKILENSVRRANSLIGAGPASERAADKLAIKQIQMQITMQETKLRMLEKRGADAVRLLNQEADLLEKQGKEEEAKQKRMDAANVEKSVGLTLTKDQIELDKQRVELAEKLEETQNRLYTHLREWADLLSSSLQGVFEASRAGDAEYYNERAKLDLTGRGGPGAGTYIVIDAAGTEDARAHYEYLDERRALERQREIENDNAVADAWKKAMDDLNQKMSDTITDQLNAMLQNQSIDANTQAVIANTEALWASMGQGSASDFSDASKLKRNADGMAVDESGQPAEQTGEAPAWKPFWQMTEEEKAKAVEDMTAMYQAHNEIAIAAETEKAAALAEIPGYTPSPAVPLTDEQIAAATEKQASLYEGMADLSDRYTDRFVENQAKMQKSEQQTDQKITAGGQSMFAKLTQAANLYGVAYQAMSNDNLSTSQRVQMIAVQAAGNAGIAALTASWGENQGEVAGSLPAILAKCLKINPIYGTVIFAALSAVLGGLMGLAASKIAKNKAEISQATGASVGAGRLSTGMMTYAGGNVDEFTDPASLTPGRSYNVDAADGRTYRAKYTGRSARTHLTSGPEFHLAGEKGREMIIDAGTTRQITMNEAGIWHAIQTLSAGGRLSHAQRRGPGVHAFADGNVDEFEDMAVTADGAGGGTGGMSPEQAAAFQSSLDRNNELLERALTEGIHARFDVYGRGGLLDAYDTGKKTVTRHGEKY